MTVSSVGALLP